MMTAEHKLKMRQGRERRKRIDAYYKGLDEQRKAAAVAAEREAKRRETLNTVTLTLTHLELKLWDRAMDAASSENEWRFALIKLGESLRARQITNL
jgi:hypothetical protein